MFFLEKSIHNITESYNQLNHRRRSCKAFQGNAIFCWFLPSIWFHTRKKDRANTSSLWYPWRNSYSHNDTQEIQESQGLLIGLRYRLWQFAGVEQGDTLPLRLFIIFFDDVLQTPIDIIKENSFTLKKKGKKQSIYNRICNWRRQCWWYSASSKYIYPKPIPAA